MDKHADDLINQPNLDDPAYKVADISYEVVNRYPHDPNAFTEGLAFLNGTLL